MDLAELAALDSPAARSVLATLPPYDPAMALSMTSTLRAQGLSPGVVQAVLTQSRLRTKARERWGDVVDQLILTPDGAEQATRPLVATHRASRYQRAGVTTVADLGCGIGLDALAFAAQGLSVVAMEKDPLTAEVARLNAESIGLAHRIEIRCCDVTSVGDHLLTEGVDAVFADPARRAKGRRLSRPEQWSPPLSWVLRLPAAALGIKVAPGLDRESVPDDCEFEVVSVAGDVVEAALYRGPLRDHAVRRRATLLPSGEFVTDAQLPAVSPPVGPIGRYLLEPDGAVIRSGLVGAVVDVVGGRLIDPHIAYVTTDLDLTSPLATGYYVTDVLPFNLKAIRALLRDRAVGRVTVKKRGFAAEPETIRRQLQLDRNQPGEATIILTRAGEQPLAIFVEPLSGPRGPTS